MKYCAKCKIQKPYEQFRKHKRNKDGYQYYCKVCQDQMTKDSLNKARGKKVEPYEYCMQVHAFVGRRVIRYLR